jgi:hypothetical protein
MALRKIQKYFVNQQEEVTIQCRTCGKRQTLRIANPDNKKHSVTINCPCTATFPVVLEFRQDYRQKTHIMAHFRALSTPRERARSCIIADQSQGGLLLQVSGKVPIKQDDQVIVSYRPDSTSSQEIEKTLRVCHYHPGHGIGGAFIEPPPQRNARARQVALH